MPSPPQQPSLEIVLPCLDEASALPWLLARIPPGVGVILADNGSVDGSPDLARAAGVTVVSAQQRGYGAACHAGLLAASADLVAVCDCDGTIDPADALRLAGGLTDVDLVIARRRPAGRGAWPLPARLANRELARRLRRRTGYPITDLGPLRVGRRRALLDLGLRDRRSGYPVETVLRARDAGWTISQLDVAYRPRIGRSKVTGTWRGSVRAYRDMTRLLAS